MDPLVSPRTSTSSILARRTISSAWFDALRLISPIQGEPRRDFPSNGTHEPCRSLNFTLTTKLGDIDLLGEIAGGGSYEDLLPHTVDVQLFGGPLRCVDLPTLIRVKRAAGRPKDFETIAELESILEEQERERPS